MIRHDAVLPVLEPLPPPHWSSFLSQRRSWILAGALGVVFVGTTAVVAVQRTPAPPLAEPVVAQPLQPAAAAAAVAPRGELPVPHIDDTIMLSVAVSPSTAQITIDGELMPSNPFIGRFTKAGGIHRLRAVAPGYQPKERTVSFIDNVMIDLSLNAVTPTPQPSSRRESSSRREVPARRNDPPPSRPAPASSPALAPAAVAEPPQRSERPKGEIAPRGEWEAPRKRTIDTNNPYGEER
jgi:hypothetical protein